MGLSTFRWAVVSENETKIVCCETVDDAAAEAEDYQPVAIVRLGFAQWNDEKRCYE